MGYHRTHGYWCYDHKALLENYSLYTRQVHISFVFLWCYDHDSTLVRLCSTGHIKELCALVQQYVDIIMVCRVSLLIRSTSPLNLNNLVV